MQLPRNAPARAPLTTHGFDIGINSRRHRSFTTKFRAEVVCESAARADPGQAQPERPGVADGETPDLPSSGRRLELARIEAVLTRRSGPYLPDGDLPDRLGRRDPHDGVRRITFGRLASAR